jgi:DNA-binding MarR family transcriptional regulator
MTVSPAYITRLVDRLEANGFVQRGPDPGDRRALRVVLTARGTEVEAEMRPIMAKFSDELLSALTKTEQAQLQDYLQRLAGRAHELARQTREAE